MKRRYVVSDNQSVYASLDDQLAVNPAIANDRFWFNEGRGRTPLSYFWHSGEGGSVVYEWVLRCKY